MTLRSEPNSSSDTTDIRAYLYIDGTLVKRLGVRVKISASESSESYTYNP